MSKKRWSTPLGVRSGRAIPSGCLAMTVLLLTAACDPYTLTTVARLRDPSLASLTFNDTGGPLLLAKGTRPARATATAGFIPTGPSSRARYQVDAVRNGDGSIELEIASTLGVAGGERHLILSSTGEVFALSSEGSKLVTPSPLTQPEANLSVCLAFMDGRQHLVTYPGACRTLGFRGVLTTSWTNVAELRYDKIVAHRGMAIFAGLFPGALVVSGTVVIAASPGDKGALAGGASLIGAGVVILGLLAPYIFAPTRSQVLYPLAPGSRSE